MTYEQREWAAQHDWFSWWFRWGEGYAVVVRNDVDGDKTETFDNYQALREWAGY